MAMWEKAGLHLIVRVSEMWCSQSFFPCVNGTASLVLNGVGRGRLEAMASSRRF